MIAVAFEQLFEPERSGTFRSQHVTGRITDLHIRPRTAALYIIENRLCHHIRQRPERLPRLLLSLIIIIPQML